MNRSFRPQFGDLLRKGIPRYDVSVLIGVDLDRLDLDRPETADAVQRFCRLERERLDAIVRQIPAQPDDPQWREGDSLRLEQARDALSVLNSILAELPGEE